MLNIQEIKQKLRRPLPGILAQYELAPVNRPRYSIEDMANLTAKKSAVLILLCEIENNWHIPLIKRSSYNGSHSGQIGFPGGKQEEMDANLIDTAVRECIEEIGVKPCIEILGKLSPLYIPVSNFYVEPFVACYKETNPKFKPNKLEVSNIILLKYNYLIELKPELNSTVEEANNIKIKTPYFNIEGEKVWGATAMILNELKKIIT